MLLDWTLGEVIELGAAGPTNEIRLGLVVTPVKDLSVT